MGLKAGLAFRQAAKCRFCFPFQTLCVICSSRSSQLLLVFECELAMFASVQVLSVSGAGSCEGELSSTSEQLQGGCERCYTTAPQKAEFSFDW